MGIIARFKLLLHVVLNRHIKKDMDSLEVVRLQVINQYVFIVFLILLFDALRNLLFERYLNFAVLLTLGSLLISISLCTTIYFRERIVVVLLVITTLAVFYFCSIVGIPNSITPYYFSILFAVLFIFSERNRPYHIFLFLWVFVLFHIIPLFDFKWFIPFRESELSRYENQLSVFIQGILLFSINGYFIMYKNNAIQRLYRQAIYEDKIPDGKQKLLRHDPNTPPSSTADLVALAKEDDMTFLPLFKQSFPEFYENLLRINPKMTREELKFCALLKLGFTTKDIAKYHHLAVRSVQTKKSRLRKSFKIKAEEDLYIWIDRF